MRPCLYTACMSIKNAVQGRRNKRKGDTVERQAIAMLRSVGVCLVEKIETGWTVRRSGARIISAFPKKKSSVDFVGIIDGRMVRAECKWRANGKLGYAEIETHQRKVLSDNEKHGGLSLIIFACPAGMWVLPYRIDGWKKGSPLTAEIAASLAI